MPWKNEIDRLVTHCVLDAAKEGADKQRAFDAVRDLLALAPGRSASWFHVGVAREVLGEAAATLPEPPDAEGQQWQMLGRLDSAGRRAGRERVRELMALPDFAAAIPTPAGRVALRAVGRMLLRDGEAEQAFDLYKQHLAAVSDEGSKRDAEFLLEEALRRADRDDEEGDGDANALAHLDRAARFVKEAGLDARAGAKVDRKLGRLHQLGQRWADAVSCYRRALEHLPKDDPYRSVLVGDLALATLGVRGTLDLLPMKDRPGSAEAEALLKSEESQGEGRSYNALYTLGMLSYEKGDFGPAATAFREADTLMRENRAKARIVHARSRFFLGHCMLALGAQGPDLEEAARSIQKEAGAISLDPALKEPAIQALLAVMPDARISTGGGNGRERGERGGRGERGDRGDRGPRPEREPREGRTEREPQAERGPREGGPREGGPRDGGPREGGRGGRGDRGDRGDRGPRQDRGPREGRPEREPRGDRAARPAHDDAGPVGQPGSAPALLAEARRCAPTDPHKALDLVDRTFKSRPDFETWFGAYRVRLDALVALREPDETLSTYERFRSKLYQRSAFDRIEGLLLDPGSPLRATLGEALFQEELVELYEAMPNRGDKLVAAALAAARAHLESGDPARAARAAAILCEAEAHDAAAVAPLLAQARQASGEAATPDADECQKKLATRGSPLRLLVIGGDEGRRPIERTLHEMGQRLGFQGHWLFTGARPPVKLLREIEPTVRSANAILLHHGAGPELRDEIRRLGASLSIPVREARWLGTQGVKNEVLETLSAAT